MTGWTLQFLMSYSCGEKDYALYFRSRNNERNEFFKLSWLFRLLTGDSCLTVITAEKTWAGQTSFGLIWRKTFVSPNIPAICVHKSFQPTSFWGSIKMRFTKMLEWCNFPRNTCFHIVGYNFSGCWGRRLQSLFSKMGPLLNVKVFRLG